MYEIIPLKKENIELIRSNEDVQFSNCYTTTLTLIAKLEQYANYPIKNKNIAIHNVLEILRFIDSCNRKSDTTLIPLSSLELKSINKHYKTYMNILKELDVISPVPYDDGTYYTRPTIENKDKPKKCMQYRIHNSYLNDDLCLVIIDKHSVSEFETDTAYNKKLERTIRETRVNYRLAVIDELNHFSSGEIDADSFRIRLNKLFSLNGKRWIKKGKKVNRVYHSFSSLSKISRKHLHNEGVYFSDIDIKNCQPLLLCCLLRHEGLPVDDIYIKDCETGNLYERFMNNPDDKNERSVIKESLYSQIFFDFKPNRQQAQKFEMLYPETYSSLKLLSDDKGEKLAAKLQNIEAMIMNDIIPEKSKYYFSLFDAIYFSDIDDIGQLFRDIKAKFAVHGITPILTINDGSEIDIENNNEDYE